MQLAVHHAINRRRHPLPGHPALPSLDGLPSYADLDLDQCTRREAGGVGTDRPWEGRGLTGELDRANHGPSGRRQDGDILRYARREAKAAGS